MAYRGLSRHVDIEGLPSPGNRFTLQELIGEGTYGEVFCALDTTTGQIPFFISHSLGAECWQKVEFCGDETKYILPVTYFQSSDICHGIKLFPPLKSENLTVCNKVLLH